MQAQTPSSSASSNTRMPAKLPDKFEDRLKVFEGEINFQMSIFNDPIADEATQMEQRRKLNLLYNEKGVINHRFREYVESIHDFTHALEYLKTDVAYVNRAMLFVRLGFPKQALDDINSALSCNPKNEHASTLKKGLEKNYPTLLQDC